MSPSNLLTIYQIRVSGGTREVDVSPRTKVGTAEVLVIEAAVTNGPDLVEKLRGDFVRSVAATLQAADAGAAWKEYGVTATQLAEHTSSLRPTASRAGAPADPPIARACDSPFRSCFRVQGAAADALHSWSEQTVRILVFGATGSTGCHVVDQLLLAGHDVTAVVRRPDQVAPRRVWSSARAMWSMLPACTRAAAVPTRS